MPPAATAPDGVEIAYDVNGSGTPALVLVHGWACDRGYWPGQVDALAAHRTVVTVDLAGHGESGTNRSDWLLPAFGGDVVAVIDHLGLHEVVLVGHSFGGDVIVEAALRLGNRVRGLVWVDTYRVLGDVSPESELRSFAKPFHEDFTRAAESFVRGMFAPTAPRDLVESVVADMASAPPEIAVATLETAIGCERFVLDSLPRLRVPVFAINPDHAPTDLDNLSDHGVHAVVLPGVDHFLMLEDPEQFNRALEGILEELAGSTA